MDNLSADKVEGVRQTIDAAGARLVYPPPYSPDPNPIELAFAKLKALLRKAAERLSGWAGSRRHVDHRGSLEWFTRRLP